MGEARAVAEPVQLGDLDPKQLHELVRSVLNFFPYESMWSCSVIIYFHRTEWKIGKNMDLFPSISHAFPKKKFRLIATAVIMWSFPIIFHPCMVHIRLQSTVKEFSLAAADAATEELNWKRSKWIEDWTSVSCSPLPQLKRVALGTKPPRKFLTSLLQPEYLIKLNIYYLKN